MSNENDPEVEQPRASSRRADRPDSGSEVRWIEWLCIGLAAGVLAQAALAGQFLTGRHWLVASHRVLAEALPLVAVGLVVLAWRQRSAGRDATLLFWGAIAVLGLLVAQTGLGFAGRSSPGAIAIHIPLGVALLGLLVAMACTARSSATDRIAPVATP